MAFWSITSGGMVRFLRHCTGSSGKARTLSSGAESPSFAAPARLLSPATASHVAVRSVQLYVTSNSPMVPKPAWPIPCTTRATRLGGASR